MFGLQTKALVVGILIGWFVVPKVAGKLNLPTGM